MVSGGTVGRRFAVACALVLALGGGRAAAQCNVPEQCSSAESCSETLDSLTIPRYQIEYEGRTYNAGLDETTFQYRVCALVANPNLGHWVLGLCPDLQSAVVSATPVSGGNGIVAPDPQTCLDGYKFNTPGGVPACMGTCPGGSTTGTIYTITFSGNIATDIVPAGVSVATRAGTIVDDTCLEGPSCPVVTTTTTTSTTTSSTTSSSTTSTTTSSTSSSSTSSTTSTTEEPTTTTSSTTSTSTSSTTSSQPDGTTTTSSTEGPTTTTTSTTEESTTTTSSTTSSSSSSSTSSTTSTTDTTSSTINPSTTTTTSSTTTSTTLPQCMDDLACDDMDVCTDDMCDGGICVHDPIPPGGPEVICNDMLDNDCDGVVDCDDPDCPGVNPCPPIKRDPSRIVFGAPGELDQFTSHGRVEPLRRVDPSTVETGWMLTHGQGPVWRGALIPGDLERSRDGTVFRFTDHEARHGRGRRFGIAKVKIRKSRTGSSYGYRIQAYGDFSTASAGMALQFYIGDEAFIFDEPWIARPYGWRSGPFAR